MYPEIINYINVVLYFREKSVVYILYEYNKINSWYTRRIWLIISTYYCYREKGYNCTLTLHYISLTDKQDN